jgi:sigma-E factor negative regulatory protein RseC
MITENGIIKEIRNDRALVKVQRGSACGRCRSRGACRTMNDKEMLVEVINDLHAQVGDEVEISLPTGSFLKISFLVYFVPVVALVAGAILGGELAPSYNWDANLASACAGGLAMMITFVAVNRFDRSLSAKAQYWPRITRLLPPSPQPCDSR